jgi:hypothetical protein
VWRGFISEFINSSKGRRVQIVVGPFFPLADSTKLTHPSVAGIFSAVPLLRKSAARRGDGIGKFALEAVQLDVTDSGQTGLVDVRPLYRRTCEFDKFACGSAQSLGYLFFLFSPRAVFPLPFFESPKVVLHAASRERSDEYAYERKDSLLHTKF